MNTPATSDMVRRLNFLFLIFLFTSCLNFKFSRDISNVEDSRVQKLAARLGLQESDTYRYSSLSEFVNLKEECKRGIGQIEVYRNDGTRVLGFEEQDFLFQLPTDSLISFCRAESEDIAKILEYQGPLHPFEKLPKMQDCYSLTSLDGVHFFLDNYSSYDYIVLITWSTKVKHSQKRLRDWKTSIDKSGYNLKAVFFNVDFFESGSKVDPTK